MCKWKQKTVFSQCRKSDKDAYRLLSSSGFDQKALPFFFFFFQHQCGPFSMWQVPIPSQVGCCPSCTGGASPGAVNKGCFGGEWSSATYLSDLWEGALQPIFPAAPQRSCSLQEWLKCYAESLGSHRNSLEFEIDIWTRMDQGMFSTQPWVTGLLDSRF